jgi:hypothetical protein
MGTIDPTKFTYHTSKYLSNTPAFKFVVDSWYVLFKKGWVDNELPFWNGHQVAYTMDGDRCIAAVVWWVEREKALITFLAVDDEYQMNGAMSRLRQVVRKELLKQGVRIMNGIIHVDNVTAQKLAEASGYELLWYKTRYELHPDDPERLDDDEKIKLYPEENIPGRVSRNW